MESCTPLLLAPKGANLRLVWPAFCVTGKCSLLGTVRSFLELFFSISFLVSLVLQSTQRVHLTIDFIDLGTKYVLTSSPELSLAKMEPIFQFAVGISSWCQHGGWPRARRFQLV